MGEFGAVFSSYRVDETRPGTRCNGGLKVRNADELPGDAAEAGDDRRKLRRTRRRARAWPGRHIGPRCQDRVTAPGGGFGGVGITGGELGMERRPGAGSRRE